MRVLVVDDSKFMRLAIKSMLEKDQKHQVVDEAETDVSAVEKYKSAKPDFVTMDIIMPIESGLRAVKEIIQFDPNAKILMVSAMGQEKIVEETVQLGAKGFVVKPIKVDELLKKIDDMFK